MEDNTVTKKEAEEAYTIIRHAIRTAAIAIDPDMWKALRTFEPNLDLSINTNINTFFGKHYIKGMLDEMDRQKKQGTSEYTKTYILMSNIIALYLYLQISKILYVKSVANYHLGGFGTTLENVKEKVTDTYLIYDVEEELLKATENHKWCFATNIPFMLVGFTDSETTNTIYIVIMDYNGHLVSYTDLWIDRDNELILQMSNWVHNMNYSIMVEHVDIDNENSLILSGGFTTCQLFSNKDTKAKDFTVYIIDKSEYKRSLKKNKDNPNFEYIYTESAKKNSYMMLQNSYACHMAFSEYINREPEIKKLVERMERLTPSTLKAVEKDHPHINKLIQTLYKYEEFDEAPIKRVSRGGTHASPCQHERRETKRYNPKTGKRDIYVKGCTVNKGKEKAQYYKNK